MTAMRAQLQRAAAAGSLRHHWPLAGLVAARGGLLAHAAQQPMLQPPRWIRTNMCRSANHDCACGTPVAVLHRR
eukprot:COSAG05_NODE_20464_length_279_cov_0.577778_1_plen_73_part_10